MKDLTRHKGLFEVIERLDGSSNGNPRFLCSIGGYLCKTTVDSALGYAVQNYDGKQCEAVIGTHYGVTSLSECNELKESE